MYTLMEDWAPHPVEESYMGWLITTTVETERVVIMMNNKSV